MFWAPLKKSEHHLPDEVEKQKHYMVKYNTNKIIRTLVTSTNL